MSPGFFKTAYSSAKKGIKRTTTNITSAPTKYLNEREERLEKESVLKAKAKKLEMDEYYKRKEKQLLYQAKQKAKARVEKKPFLQKMVEVDKKLKSDKGLPNVFNYEAPKKKSKPEMLKLF